MKKIIIFCLSVLFLQSCNTSKQQIQKEIIWINSSKTTCTGVSKMNCLQIQKNNTLDYSKNWEVFYNEIDGFTYEPGFIYKIEVQIDTIENPPVDASNLKYTLVNVLKKQVDLRYAIHDIWVLSKVNMTEIDNSVKRPQIEFNISKMKIFGSDGCNNINGNIEIVDDRKITLGKLMQTRKMCQDMEIPNKFIKSLYEVTNYKREGNTLLLLNKEEKIVLEFKKTD